MLTPHNPQNKILLMKMRRQFLAIKFYSQQIPQKFSKIIKIFL